RPKRVRPPRRPHRSLPSLSPARRSPRERRRATAAALRRTALLGAAPAGLRLRDAYITATIRCAPPLNKPLPAEIVRCEPYLLEELRLLDRVRVVVGLGRIGWQAYLRTRRRLGLARPRKTPQFGHGVPTEFEDGFTLLACYHPSQQNTFTGKLTRPMLRGVFHQARALLDR